MEILPRVGIGIILNTLRKKGILTEESKGKQLRKCLSDFDLTVIDLDPDIIVILAGINDIAENTGPSSVKSITDNIISMSELAIANNIMIISSIIPAKIFHGDLR